MYFLKVFEIVLRTYQRLLTSEKLPNIFFIYLCKCLSIHLSVSLYFLWYPCQLRLWFPIHCAALHCAAGIPCVRARCTIGKYEQSKLGVQGSCLSFIFFSASYSAPVAGSIHLYLFLSMCLYFYLSFYLSLSIYLSIYPSVNLTNFFSVPELRSLISIFYPASLVQYL